jgi:hypothetical protein
MRALEAPVERSRGFLCLTQRIAMNIAAYLVAGLVLALVLGIWLHAITVWLFVH